MMEGEKLLPQRHGDTEKVKSLVTQIMLVSNLSKVLFDFIFSVSLCLCGGFWVLSK